MNDLKWRFVTFKLWRHLFFRLDKIEKISDNHTKATYVYRFGNKYIRTNKLKFKVK